MFFLQNGTISSKKLLSLGELRKVDLNFCFDTTFDDGDTFSLTLGEFASSLYSFTNSGLLTFSRVDFSSISQKSISASIIIKRNGTETILSDTLNITAAISGGGGGGGAADLGNYNGEIHLTGSADGSSAPVLNFENKTIKIGSTANVITDDVGADFKVLADKTQIIGGDSLQLQSYKLGGRNSSLILSSGRIDAAAADGARFDGNFQGYGNFFITGNLDVNGDFCVNETKLFSSYYDELNYNLTSPYVNSTYLTDGFYSLRFDDEIIIDNIYSTQSDFTLQFNEIYSENVSANKCYTKEIWLCPYYGDITTLQIDEVFQVIGQMPTRLEARSDVNRRWCYVFICKFCMNGWSAYFYPTIQYSHRFQILNDKF